MTGVQTCALPILSVAKDQTTLYDQIRYQGAPESFAWVLPIAGQVDVGLSADTVFGVLHNLTATVVQAPPTRCPPPPDCGYDEEAPQASAGGSADAGTSVEVLSQKIVGPYETVQLRSSDPDALTTWLTQNGFAIASDVAPVIADYVAEKFDFLALRLRPGQGVNAMRPVRVTTQGAAATLPLRMVAAGTGATVGITLWVVGEGRYEPQNFPSFFIPSAELTWDWATGASDYKDLRAARAGALAGKGWELESSNDLYRGTFESTLGFAGRAGNGQLGSDYAPIEENGVIVKTPEQARTLDMATLFHGQPNVVRVTRLRADLAHAALTSDLALVASSDQSVLPNVRTPSKEKGEPQCPVYQGCSQVGTAPRGEAIAQAAAASGDDSSCRVAPAKQTGGSGGLGLLGALAFAGTAVLRSRRARR